KGGYGISWNDELDISCNELYEQGVNADEIADDEFCIQLLENYNKSYDKGEFIPLDDAAKMCRVDIT
ncbi:MAG: hypothetical protein LIO62_04840, partial [Clostridiales bacterium]|nr:hypothetical protein [Clostridiales bacterium]